MSKISDKIKEYIEEARQFDLGDDYVAVLPGIVGGTAIAVKVDEILEDGLISQGILIPYVFGIVKINEATANEIRSQRSGITIPKIVTK